MLFIIAQALRPGSGRRRVPASAEMQGEEITGHSFLEGVLMITGSGGMAFRLRF